MAHDAARRPLLFLDVDGPLIPWGRPPADFPTYPGLLEDDSHPGLARLNPAHGPRLAALACDLVWATAWEHEANELVAPWMGLPQLEVVVFPADDRQDERIGLHYKTRALIDRAAGRPFVWIDDEITDIDREWVRAYHRGIALLHYVDPRQGLTDADYAVISAWLRGR